MTFTIVPFIRGLKQNYPESAWPWLFGALQRDALVWEALGGQVGQELLSQVPESPEDLTPARLALLTLGLSVEPDRLRTIPMQPLEEVKTIVPPAGGSLAGAGLEGIHLRERRFQAGAWDQLRDEIRQASPTGLACLFGMIPDPIDLAHNLVLTADPCTPGNHSIELALHAFLSNPLPPESRFEFLNTLFGYLRADAVLAVLRQLGKEESSLAASLALDLPHHLELDAFQPALQPGDPLAEIQSGLIQVDALRLAGQSASALEALQRSFEMLRRLQAQIKARAARIDAQAGNTHVAFVEWLEACQLDPDSASHPAELALTYLDAGKPAEAEALLADLDRNIPHPLVHLARSRLAMERAEREEAAREAALTLDLLSSKTQSLHEESADLSAPAAFLAGLLLDLRQPAKSASAAQLTVQWHPENADYQALHGRALAAGGALEPAVLANHLAVALAPARLDLRRQLAESLELIGDWDAAQDERAVLMERLVPVSTENLHALAACALNAGRPAHAVHLCQQLIAQDPDDGLAYARLGEASAALGDTQPALEYLQKAIQLSPSHPLPWLALARLHKSTGAIQKAQETLRAATYAAPEFPEIHLALGESFLEQGALTQALNDLRIATDLSAPREEAPLYSPEAFQQAQLRRMIALRLGQTLHQLGHQDEARQVLEEAYQAAPSNPELAGGYAQILISQGRLDQALAPLETVLQDFPAEITPYLEYARCLLALYHEGGCDVHVERALPALRHILEIQPEQAEAQALLGEALCACEEPEPAMDAFNKALTSDLVKDPLWQARLSLGLGQAALQNGEVETAVAALREANQIDPLNIKVQRALAEAYEAAGLIEDAFQTARAALLLAPSDVDTLIWFTDEVVRLQNLPGASLPEAQNEAINALNRAAQLAPSRADLLVRLGQTQFKIGNRTAARETLRLLAEEDLTLPCIQGRASDFHQAARGLLHLGDPQAAVVCLERALEAGKVDESLSRTAAIDLYIDLSQAYFQAGNHPAALQALERAIIIAPNEPALFLSKANLLTEIDKSQTPAASNGAIDSEVLHCLETAIKLSPGDPALHYRVALIHRASGHLTAAMAHAQHMIEVCQDTGSEIIQARALEAELCLAMLQTDRARLFLEDELPAIGKSDAVIQSGALEIHCLRAELALETNEDYLAINELVKAVEIDPADLRVQALQARLAFRRNEDQTAIDLFNALVESLDGLPQPGPDTLRSIAEASLEMHQWEKSMTILHRLVQAAPLEPLAHFSLARALVLQAEQQRLYQAVDVIQRAPGEAALSTEIQQRLSTALLETETLLKKWTGGQAPASDAFIEQWRARGQAAYDPSEESAQRLAALPSSPENVAAQIGCLRLTGDLTSAGLLARDYPKNPQILLQLALALVNEKPRQALAAAKAAADLLAEAQTNGHSRPTYRNKDLAPIVQALLARLFHRSGDRAGDHANAMQAINNALASWPDEPRWHILAAEIYQGRDQQDDLINIEDTIGHLEFAIHLDPKYAPPYLTLGQIYLSLGLLNKATQTCEMASRLAPEQPEVWQLLAEAYRLQGNLTQAAIHAEQAVTLSPDQVSPLVLCGQIALEAGDPRTAQSKAQAALQLDAQHPDALLLLAKSLEGLDRHEEALAMIDKALQFIAQPLPLLLERVRLLNHAQGLQVARQSIQQLNESYPDQPSVLALLAELLASAGEADGAIRAAQRALRLNAELMALLPKEQAQLQLLLGKLLRQAGQLDQAIYHLSEGIRLVPDLIEAYLEMGEAHKERRQYSQALNVYRQATTIAPDDYRPYYQIGVTLKDSKDYQGAEKMLRRATELAPADPSIHRLLAAVVALNLVQNHREPSPDFPNWNDTF